MKNNNKYIWWIVGVIVVILVVWLIARNRSQDMANNQIPTPEATPAATPTPATPAPVTTNNPGYNAAIAKYGTNRIQIQQSCQTSPNNVVYKNGTTIMLDNRASITHKLKIDSKTYTIGAYNFTTVTLSSATLPHTIQMDCDSSQNVATILIEK